MDIWASPCLRLCLGGSAACEAFNALVGLQQPLSVFKDPGVK